MKPEIKHAELFGVTESSAQLYFTVEDGSGPIDAPARVLLDGEVRALSDGTSGVRGVRLEGLAPDACYRIAIEADGAAEPARHDAYFPERFETLAAPRGEQVASFATLNDLHFGEPRFGGTLVAEGEFGEESEGSPVARATDTDVPYWQIMNEDAIEEINASGVDAAIIKGDIADRGQPEQFEEAARAFGRFRMPHEALLGNHDHYALLEGEKVDGCSLLGMDPTPRAFDLGGWRLVLVDTVEPGEHHGVLPDERIDWISAELDRSNVSGTPTLLFMHHQPVPPEHASSYPNTIGIVPEHSLRLFDLLGQHPQVRAVLIGHTHRNVVRRYAASGNIPYVEVNCTKDYPGGWGHYRLFSDGSLRQEVRRTSSARALAHSARCRDFFRGGYRIFSLGSLRDRSFEI